MTDANATQAPDFQILSGRYYRIIFRNQQNKILKPVPSPEGRFHHDDQRAIYLSPSPAAAAVAIDSYYRADDPPRVLVPLMVTGANILDFRKPSTVEKLGLIGGEVSVNWRAQRRTGQAAGSWLASDAARCAGADGMIYPSRKAPAHWHLVLFKWNAPDAPSICTDGAILAFDSGQ